MRHIFKMDDLSSIFGNNIIAGVMEATINHQWLITFVTMHSKMNYVMQYFFNPYKYTSSNPKISDSSFTS